jgi:hypothetical protein
MPSDISSRALSGTGALLPTSSLPAIVVVENGNINIAGSSNITASNVTFVMTGSNSYSHSIVFPNGAGHAATLTIEPPQNSSTVWNGIAIYDDPALTQNVDANFGPGASLIFDGVAYMPFSNITFHGNTASGSGQCSELIVNTFTSSGSGTLSYAQSKAACANYGINLAYPHLLQ